jgi:hypothetical protein
MGRSGEDDIERRQDGPELLPVVSCGVKGFVVEWWMEIAETLGAYHARRSRLVSLGEATGLSFRSSWVAMGWSP